MPRPDHTSQTVFPASSCVNHSSNPRQHSFHEKKMWSFSFWKNYTYFYFILCVCVVAVWGCHSEVVEVWGQILRVCSLTVFDPRIKLSSIGLTFNTLSHFNESQGKVLVRRDPLLQRSWGLSEPSCLFTKIRYMGSFFAEFYLFIYFQFKFLFKCMDLLPACVCVRTCVHTCVHMCACVCTHTQCTIYIPGAAEAKRRH